MEFRTGPEQDMPSRRVFHLHLVSDATGETLNAVARAACAQYEDAHPIEHVYALVRGPKQLEPVMGALGRYLGRKSSHKPGSQHTMNAEYFGRIEALNYTMAHDDGQSAGDLNEADIILVGVSRTSKTPTCIYLANRGIKAANIPIVPGVVLPPDLETATHPLIVGLTTSPDRLVQIRKNRLLSLHENTQTDYVDHDAVSEEVTIARKLCAKHGWPVIDVTRRSIEETAAAVLNLYNDRLKTAEKI